jgi:hypothetical protein
VTTDPWTFSHTPSAAPKGILLFVGQRQSATDHIVSVSYGARALARVTPFGLDSIGTVLGRAEWWFAGSAIPTGIQTITIDLDAATTDDLYFVCCSILGAADIEVVDADALSENRADPQVTLQFGGRNCLALCGVYSGLVDATQLTDLAGQTRVHDQWQGQGWIVSRETAPGTSDVTMGYVSATSANAFAALALAEVTPAGGQAPRTMQQQRIRRGY